ncbi:MAG: calcium/sodium antiporter [Patescibacteria group bacterium]
MIFLLVVLLMIGGWALYKGADLIVDHASHLAAKLGVSTAVVGLTGVALAGVLPEFSIGITSALANANDLIIGNALGSSVLKLALVLGLAALIYPLAIQTSILRHEIPWLLLATVFVFFLAWDLTISRNDGLMLIILAVGFEWYCIRTARRDLLLEVGQRQVVLNRRRPLERGRVWLKIALGLLLIILGAKLFVDSSLSLAHYWGVSQLFVGMLVIALGTSLPELVVTIMAAVRHQAALGIGNIIGSNVMNIFLVVGATALINPLRVHPDLLIFDFPMLIFFTLLASLMFKSHHRLTRLEGAFLVLGYVVYFVYSVKFWG